MAAARSLSPIMAGAHGKAIVDTHRAPTWKAVDGEKSVKVRLVAMGYQGPDLKEGNINIAGCISRPSSHLEAIPFAARK